MDLSQTHPIIFLALAFVAAGIGAYVGAYLKQKGKNLATHQDIDALVDQVTAVTETTKEIEAKITNEVWDRQRRWELKRNVLLEATKRVAAVEDALSHLNSAVQAAIMNPTAWSVAASLEVKNEQNLKWFKALSELEESELFVGVTCGKNAEDAIQTFRRFAVSIAYKINGKDGAILKDSFSRRLDLKNAIREAIRKELSIDNVEADRI